MCVSFIINNTNFKIQSQIEMIIHLFYFIDNPNVSQWVSADWKIFTTVGWISLIFCTEIRGTQRMNPNYWMDCQSWYTVMSSFGMNCRNFGDLLTFHLVP